MSNYYEGEAVAGRGLSTGSGQPASVTLPEGNRIDLQRELSAKSIRSSRNQRDFLEARLLLEEQGTVSPSNLNRSALQAAIAQIGDEVKQG